MKASFSLLALAAVAAGSAQAAKVTLTLNNVKCVFKTACAAAESTGGSWWETCTPAVLKDGKFTVEVEEMTVMNYLYVCPSHPACSDHPRGSVCALGLCLALNATPRNGRVVQHLSGA